MDKENDEVDIEATTDVTKDEHEDDNVVWATLGLPRRARKYQGCGPGPLRVAMCEGVKPKNWSGLRVTE